MLIIPLRKMKILIQQEPGRLNSVVDDEMDKHASKAVALGNGLSTSVGVAILKP